MHILIDATVTYHETICRLRSTTSHHTVQGFHPSHVYRRRTFPTLNQSTWLCVYVHFQWSYYSKTFTCATHQSLKLSRVQVYHVTIFHIRLKMGLCADTQCLQVASMVINLLISNLLHSCASFNLFITLINDGFLSWVTRLQRFIRSFDVAVCARLSWGLATVKWREAVEEDCQSAI